MPFAAKGCRLPPYTARQSPESSVFTPIAARLSHIPARRSLSLSRRRNTPFITLLPLAAAISTERTGARSGVSVMSTPSLWRGDAVARQKSVPSVTVAPIPRRMSAIARSRWVLVGSSPVTVTSPHSAPAASMNAAPDQSPSAFTRAGARIARPSIL